MESERAGHSASPMSLPATEGVHALYDAHFRSVWRVLRRLGVADSTLDDAVQDVFLVVHRRISEFEVEKSPKALLAGIATRVASDYRRSERRRGPNEPLSESLVDTAPTPIDSASSAQRLRAAQTALNTLDEAKREVFILSDLEGLTAPEVAEALQTNVNTVYSRLRAARLEFNQAIARMEAQP